MSGHISEHAAAANKGSTSQSTAFGPNPLSDVTPELGDGTWTFQIDFGTADGDKLIGTASVTLESGQVYPFNFVGLYNPNTGQSKLILKGHDAGLGSILQVLLNGTDILKVTGRVSGQLVNIK